MPATIKKVQAMDFLGLSAATIEPKKPVVVISGGNAAGKTSLYQAIRYALFDLIPRVDLKKEAPALVRDGAVKGSIRVTIDDFGVERELAVALPTGRRSGEDVNETFADLYLTLDPFTFTAMSNAERAKLLLRLSGVKMTADVIADRLAARGTPPQFVTDIKPLLTLGFEKCAAHAKEQASQARGAWKQLTGETYGSQKAASWRPPKPGDLPAAPVKHTDAVERHSAATAALAKLEATRQGHTARAERDTKDRVLAPKVEELRSRVATLMTAASAPIEQATLECPKCNESLVLDGGKLTIFTPEARPTVAPATRARAEAELTIARREYGAAEAAAARLTEPYDGDPNPTDEAIQKARDAVNDAAAVLTSLSRDHEVYTAAVRAQTQAKEVEEKAKARHQDAVAWDAVAEALSPGGIPSELMKAALEPLRTAITAVARSTYVRHWPIPVITDDADIQAWGRPIALLSESEHYRVGVLLAAALATMTKVGTIAMDRADVLAPAERSNLVGWLFDMCDPEDGSTPLLAQAWVFMTTKAAMSETDAPLEEHRMHLGAVQ